MTPETPPGITERLRNAAPGIALLLAFIALELASIGGIIAAAIGGRGSLIVVAIVSAIVWGFALAGFFMVQPNEAKVLTLFGAYAGTARLPGLRWANPFLSKRSISLRVRNFETAKLKVNDNRGNPIEIAAVVVWKVVDAAEAAFEVDSYENYVHVQSEAALRNMATGYPYDAHEDAEVALSSHTAEISGRLTKEIHDRLTRAGVKVIESRISHLAYAPEIASVMLRRQQASAVVAARRLIVAGAVGMVEHALEMLAEKRVIQLDEERKAAMVSNLLVVLCGEAQAQPVVNTGSLYT